MMISNQGMQKSNSNLNCDCGCKNQRCTSKSKNSKKQQKEKILFVCAHNKRRSIMAESFAKYEGLDAYSAGLEKGENYEVDEMVILVMDELGLPVKQKSDTIDEIMDKIKGVDILITMGCIGACPYVPAKKHIAWEFEDPKGKDIHFYRKIRDEIEIKVIELSEILNEYE
ncbi:low molecular weight phosphatase family protein [Methanococcus voltae]|uniref:Protein-tyrosine phosphatase, low molecular weight n=1 Tax=Methanococcus voltae (strain ATCC BAA-1334 / A3) TaxID=456320 RepID=D7DTJ6_METV3|nr:low molecular weight phosphatase family protein [Methanococcus voltae]MCS3901308.1 protein-tyrosine-phosphatase [Methanococcus voltae]